MLLLRFSFIAGRDRSFVVAVRAAPMGRSLPSHVSGLFGICGDGNGGFRLGE